MRRNNWACSTVACAEANPHHTEGPIMTTPSSFVHVDLTGMNRITMLDAPAITSEVNLKEVMESSRAKLSIAGMRHSQGGHTAIKDGRMLITETFNAVDLKHPAPGFGSHPPDSVAAQAGATWSVLHRSLCTRRRSPQVQQSSAHFSLGGSLSVNCHGREVRWGSVSDTVESLTIMTGLGDVLTASPTEHADLFSAVLGGYGACGMILEARLCLTPNFMLGRYWELQDLAAYERDLRRIDDRTYAQKVVPTRGPLHLHHGWVNVTADGYLAQVINYTVREVIQKTEGNENGIVEKASNLRHEGWGTSEILRAGWSASRKDDAFGRSVWDRLKSKVHSPQSMYGSRLDFLREEIMFTSSKGNSAGVDLLQEYFLPLNQLSEFLGGLKRIFPHRGASDVRLLSCTTRYVRGETGIVPLLSYCQSEPRVSVAIDGYVKRDDRQQPTSRACAQFREAIALALHLGGTFYLPYHRFADALQLRAGYTQLDEWLATVDKYNPGRRFHNDFLQHYRL